MPHIANTRVTSAKLLKEGSGKKGPWKLYVFTVDDPKWKDVEIRGFLHGSADLVPGDVVEHIEVAEDEYQGKKRWEVKSLEMPPSPNKDPGPKSSPGPGQGPSGPVSGGSAGSDDRMLSFCLAYAKDLKVALIEAKSITLVQDIVEDVVTGALMMKKWSTDPAGFREYLKRKESHPNETPKD